MKFPEFYSYLSNVLLVDKGLRQPNLRPRVREEVSAGGSSLLTGRDRLEGSVGKEGLRGQVGWGPRARTDQQHPL